MVLSLIRGRCSATAVAVASEKETQIILTQKKNRIYYCVYLAEIFKEYNSKGLGYIGAC